LPNSIKSLKEQRHSFNNKKESELKEQFGIADVMVLRNLIQPKDLLHGSD